MAKSVPAGMALKMVGSTMKTSPAPPLGSPPAENSAGKMIRPARMAMSVSKNATETPAKAMFSFFER